MELTEPSDPEAAFRDATGTPPTYSLSASELSPCQAVRAGGDKEDKDKDCRSLVRSLSCWFLQALSTWRLESTNRKQWSCVPLPLPFCSK